MALFIGLHFSYVEVRLSQGVFYSSVSGQPQEISQFNTETAEAPLLHGMYAAHA